VKGLGSPATETQVTHAQRLWLYVLAGFILVFLVAPTLIVVPMSFTDSTFLEFPPRQWSLRWYRNYFGTVEWRDATYTSLVVALWTVILATPLGTAAAYGLQVARLGWSSVVFIVLLLPMMVPHILTAIGAFFAYSKMGILNSRIGLVLAHTILAIPVVLVVVTAGLKSYDMSQEMAARSLGASRLRAFLRITLPQIRVSVLSAALFAFITSFDEVIIALFVATGPSSTLTRRMFLALRDAIDPTIAAISTLLVVLSVSLLLVLQLVGGFRSRER
jgi:putative spermidine/putrescine transport system permease protein